jgi:four helix bundle protein
MAGFKSFEEINAWKKGHDLVLELYHITNNSKGLSSDFGLKDQLRRAAVSITSNIAEGHERNTKKDFARFLNMSKGSAAEVRNQILIARDLNYITFDEYESMRSKLIEIGSMLSGLRSYLLKE